MKNFLRDITIASAITLIPTLFLWAPFLLRMPSFWGIPLPTSGMATIAANYDGPLYIVVAKTFYNSQAIQQNFPFPLPSEYYAAHFPLFPLLIRTFSPILGNLYSMLFVTLGSGIVATYYFYKFIREFVGEKNALFITFVFSILPARWLISHSVGSADPLFVAGILASIYHFRREEYWKAGLWGAVAQATKSAGLLLFVAYILYLIFRKMHKIVHSSSLDWLKSFEILKTAPILLIPLALVAVFYSYQLTMGNFFAYFNSGDNIHLFFPPFQIFNYNQPWVGTFWLEEIIFIYLFGALGLFRLIKDKEYLLAWFVGIFFASLLMVSHRDLMRYALPIVPFIFAAFAKPLTSKEFKFAFLIIIIPIYLFALSFVSQNVMPISDWGPLL